MSKALDRQVNKKVCSVSSYSMWIPHYYIPIMSGEVIKLEHGGVEKVELMG